MPISGFQRDYCQMQEAFHALQERLANARGDEYARLTTEAIRLTNAMLQMLEEKDYRLRQRGALTQIEKGRHLQPSINRRY